MREYGELEGRKKHTENPLTWYLHTIQKFGTEFHQFLIERAKLGHFEEFYGLLQHVHKIPNVDILLGYTDIQGYLLSINKDDNYHITASTTNLLLRIFTQKKRKKQTVPLVQTC
uniref:PB1 domain-containing protein n=1 Tax=Balaenoptera musculus TaxID=9771 RepID=A0A8C0DRY3_BALMU